MAIVSAAANCPFVARVITARLRSRHSLVIVVSGLELPAVAATLVTSNRATCLIRMYSPSDARDWLAWPVAGPLVLIAWRAQRGQPTARTAVACGRFSALVTGMSIAHVLRAEEISDTS